MSAKTGIILAVLGLLLLFIICPWVHWREIAGIQGGGASANSNTKATTNSNQATAAPSLKGTFENGKYRLTGTLPDQNIKDRFLVKAKEIYGEANMIDEIKIGEVADPSWMSSILALLPFTKNGVTNGGFSAEGNSVSLIGQVPSQSDKDRIYADAIKACPPNTTINNLLGIAGQKMLSDEQAKVQVKLNEAIAGKIVEFASGSDQLTDKGKAVLDELAPIFKDSKDNIEIGGHTDNAGKRESNLDLSKRRAETVKKYFAGKGLDANRFTAKGYGQDSPIADNSNDAGKQKNRRIEFQVLGGGN